jgi:hypothetical protein
MGQPARGQRDAACTSVPQNERFSGAALLRAVGRGASTPKNRAHILSPFSRQKIQLFLVREGVFFPPAVPRAVFCFSLPRRKADFSQFSVGQQVLPPLSPAHPRRTSAWSVSRLVSVGDAVFLLSSRDMRCDFCGAGNGCILARAPCVSVSRCLHSPVSLSLSLSLWRRALLSVCCVFFFLLLRC